MILCKSLAFCGKLIGNVSFNSIIGTRGGDCGRGDKLPVLLGVASAGSSSGQLELVQPLACRSSVSVSIPTQQVSFQALGPVSQLNLKLMVWLCP